MWPESPSPAPPYATWETAAHTIQEAVDAAQSPPKQSSSPMESIERRGGGTDNRVALDKAVVLHSVNGPEVTMIRAARKACGALM